MEEGLQGLLMGAVMILFLVAMQLAMQEVDSSRKLEQAAETRMMIQRNVTVEKTLEKERGVAEWMRYLDE